MYRNIITSHIACELNYLKNLPQSVSGPIINATYLDVAMTTINKMQKSKNESDQYSWTCEAAPEFWIKNHQEHHMKLSGSVFGPTTNRAYRDVAMTTINKVQKSKNKSDQYIWACEPDPDFLMKKHQEHLKNLPQSVFGPITNRSYVAFYWIGFLTQVTRIYEEFWLR